MADGRGGGGVTKRAVQPQPDNVVSIAAALDAPVDAPQLAEEGDQRPFGGRDDDDNIERPLLPRESPVKALGLGTDGTTCWYLNVLGQLVALGPREHGKNHLHALFSPRTHLLSKYWPRWSEPKYEGRGNSRTLVKDSEIVGFAQDDASEALISACGEAGIFDAQGRVRGRGAHRGKGQTLVIHYGDKVMTAKPKAGGGRAAAEWFDTGLHDGFVYPAAAATPRPHHHAGKVEAVERLLSLISTWHWRRGHLDAMLALGWIAQASIAGALNWRSHLFVTGGRGTGKSTFNGKDGLCDRVLGSGTLRTGNATEAAVRQMLRAQTIPVIFDEFEPNAFNQHKLAGVLELARVASSGGDIHRGSSDHKAAEFVLNSAFQFSAILTPHMEPQDRSRFAILELEPLQPDTPRLDLDKAGLPAIGQILARRMIDGWWRWHDTFHAYHDALTRKGHSSRSADTFGTLLAAADLALYDEMPTVELLHDWSVQCAPAAMAEIADTSEDHEACLIHLTTTMVQARGGDVRETVGTWIRRAVTAKVGSEQEAERARERLGELGLKLVNARAKPADGTGRPSYGAVEHMPGQACYLAVAQKHRALAEIFGTTKFQAGGWSQTLARAPAAIRGVKAKFGGQSLTAVLVPIELVIDQDEVTGWVACPMPEAVQA